MQSIKRVRLIVLFTLLIASALGFCVAQNQDAGDTLIAFLNQSIDWYRRVQVPGQIAIDPADSIYTSYNRSSSVQAISLIFEFARTQAAEIQLAHPQDAAAPTDSTQASRNLPQLVIKAQERVKQAASDLLTLQQQAANAPEKTRQMLNDQVAEQKSELELAQARLEAMQNMSAFATAGASAGLMGKINELERNVPEARIERTVERSVRPSPSSRGESSASSGNAGSGSAGGGSVAANAGDGEGPKSGTRGNNSASAAPSVIVPFSPVPVAAPATAPAQQKQNETGIVSLASDLFSLTNKLNAQRDAINATSQLRATLDRIRTPLRQQLRSILQKGDELSAQPQSSDPIVLADRKKQIEALTAEFKHLSTIVLPLAKTSILLDATSNNLAEWRAETERRYKTEARSLLYRVGVLLAAILAVGVASELWRRAIFRYIREQRRRNQFLLLRRIVVTLVITLIVIFGLSTEIGSLATFAGFLTAGIAVALQNVILSVAAYFFLIGRYGIRVGDRVQIGAVTGDVVDIGLVRLHLVELDTSGGEARPTGRIVVFSNSVVFQPTSNFFKQLPGSNFAWRRISLTLAPEVDYSIAQKRISGAVAAVYDTYKAELDRQHQVLESSLAIHISSTEPQTRLRLEETGLEIVILYPVVLTQAAQIDDRMTHALLEAIEGDPRLRLVGGGLTNIKPVDATPNTPVIAPVQK